MPYKLMFHKFGNNHHYEFIPCRSENKIHIEKKRSLEEKERYNMDLINLEKGPLKGTMKLFWQMVKRQTFLMDRWKFYVPKGDEICKNDMLRDGGGPNWSKT